jgi:exodeoxyribonuclease V gamma subunit
MESRTLEEWLPVCRAMLNDFFLPDQETEAAMALIEQQWQAIIEEGVDSQYGEAIPLSLLRDELTQRLDQERISQRFLAGPVNICTLMPMRSIPFKVVCLLGMNDGVYPRALAPLGFDLMSQKPQRGDRSRRDDDRYLFLEALISAQQKLYISYIGRSIQDNSLPQPSGQVIGAQAIFSSLSTSSITSIGSRMSRSSLFIKAISPKWVKRFRILEV